MAVKTSGKTGAKKKTPAVNMKALLANASKHLKKAIRRAAEERGFDEYEDGHYKARLVAADVGKSQSSNRTQLHFAWEFLDGEYEGKQKHAYQGMDTEDNLVYALRDIERLGYDVSEIEDLSEELPAILKELAKDKPAHKIRLRTKGDFQNVYIGAALDEDDLVDEDDDEEEEEEETPRKKKASSKKKKDEDEEEEEEEESEDEDEEEEEESEEDEESEDDEEEESDDEEDDEEEEELEVRVGSNVTVQTKAGKVKAEVLDIFEDENQIRVKTEKGKTLKLSAEKILSVDDVPDEPAPKKKAKKTPGKKK